jgi:hypothetical protein
VVNPFLNTTVNWLIIAYLEVTHQNLTGMMSISVAYFGEINNYANYSAHRWWYSKKMLKHNHPRVTE